MATLRGKEKEKNKKKMLISETVKIPYFEHSKSLDLVNNEYC